MKPAVRIAALTLALLLCLSLAACGGQEADEADVSYSETDPIATLTLADGRTIRIVLYPESAPQTVANFISLANSGFYDGVTFHRISAGFCIQGGDPTGTGGGGPGYTIVGEFARNGIANRVSHTAYTLSMARRSNGYDTAGSQFFITLASWTSLDGQYAAFGRVISGRKTVDELGSTPCRGETPIEPPVIASIRVDTKGVTYPEPDRIS